MPIRNYAPDPNAPYDPNAGIVNGEALGADVRPSQDGAYAGIGGLQGIADAAATGNNEDGMIQPEEKRDYLQENF